MPQPSTEVAFHALLRSLEQPNECPVCHAVNGHTDRLFESLTYDGATNEGFLNELLSTNGFCAAHAARLSRHNGGLEAALVYAGLLRHRVSWAEHSHPLRVLVERTMLRLRLIDRGADARALALHGRYAPRQACPVCVRRQRWERETIKLLMRYLQRPEVRTTFESGPGLCLPHYQAFRSRAWRVPQWLMQHQHHSMDKVVADAEQFIAAKDFARRTPAPDSTWEELMTRIDGSHQ